MARRSDGWRLRRDARRPCARQPHHRRGAERLEQAAQVRTVAGAACGHARACDLAALAGDPRRQADHARRHRLLRRDHLRTGLHRHPGGAAAGVAFQCGHAGDAAALRHDGLRGRGPRRRGGGRRRRDAVRQRQPDSARPPARHRRRLHRRRHPVSWSRPSRSAPGSAPMSARRRASPASRSPAGRSPAATCGSRISWRPT